MSALFGMLFSRQWLPILLTRNEMYFMYALRAIVISKCIAGIFLTVPVLCYIYIVKPDKTF
jgi:dolichyl-phosphate-mannose--protein O-mannosyl transferase